METRSDENDHSEDIPLDVFKETGEEHDNSHHRTQTKLTVEKSMFNETGDHPSESVCDETDSRRRRITVIDEPRGDFMKHKSMFMEALSAINSSPRSNSERWIGSTFYRKECIRFVSKTPGSHLCFCGRTIKQHQHVTHSASFAALCEAIVENTRAWDPKGDIKKLPTDAYGDLSFHTFIRSRKPSKYIRLSEDTDPKLILELLMNEWKLPRPKLVISVSGGHKNCKLKPQQKINFTTALEKASHNEGTWILTCGTNCGVTKLVGDAVENRQSVKIEERRVMQKISCIGIAPWGYLENKEDLINEKDTGINDAKRHGPFHTQLNSNHTHFILVDDGTIGLGAYLKMRSIIEEALLAEDIPLVLVLLEGGIDNIQHVHESLRLGVPTVVCNGSGRAADIISYAHKHAGNVESGLNELSDVEALQKVEDMIHSSYGDMERKSIELYTIMNQINRIVCNNMITVFEMGNDSDGTVFKGGPGLSEIIMEFAKHSWVVTHFEKKACMRFVRAPSSTTQSCSNICHCGRTEHQHRKQHIDPKNLRAIMRRRKDRRGASGSFSYDTEWNPEEDLIKCQTDAFGEISFTPKVGNGNIHSSAKYIRLEEGTDPKLILHLLMKHWNLPRPELVISVIGGRMNLELSHEDRKNFNTALKKASRTACTWILTGGTNCGATQCIGEAVREGQSIKWEGNKAVKTINCIGFAPWGYVDDTNCLVRKRGPGLYHTEYCYLKPVIRGKPVPLNPNHTHFILVDDGRKNRSGGADLRLRSKIEKTIMEDKIPLVLLVLEGGRETIDHLRDSTNIGVPAVLCNGTGRAADIVSFVYNNVERTDRWLGSPALKDLKATLHSKYGVPYEGEEMEQLVEEIHACVKDEHLITVFEMGREWNSDMNLAIMTALLHGHCAMFYQQLSLAISWNRVDIAERIFDNDMNSCVNNEFITHALVDNKVEFVKLFIGRRSIMKNYLTVARLSQLYNNEVDVDDILHIMRKVKGYTNAQRPIYLQDVRNLFRFLIGVDKPVYRLDNSAKLAVVRRGISDAVLTTELLELPSIITFLKGVYDDFEHPGQRLETDYQLEYGEYLGEIAKPDLLFEQPFTEMFLWAAITNRVEMAEFFWEQGSNPLSSAIAASKLLDTIQHLTKDSDRKETVQKNAKLFKNLATEVIDECYHTNKKLATMLIESPHPHWKYKKPLIMAAETQNKDFISHPCCKGLLDEKWYGQLSPYHNRPWQVLIALLTILFPVMVLYRRRFKDQKGVQPLFYRKLGLFFRAPITKFWIHLLSFVAFLLLYSYMLLFQFSMTPDVLGIVLCVWIVTMVFEETRELFATRDKNETLTQAFFKWLGSKSNIMDAAMFAAGVTGFALQWFETTHEWSRTLHAANSFVLFSRVLRYFAVSERLGPKMVMIGKMIDEMMLFLSILFVFLVSYGIASNALLYPDQKLSQGSIKRIFFTPYFQIYGELFLDDIEGECEHEDTTLCPQNHWLVPIMLGIYLLLGNVLLLNLLIAIFSSVYLHVETNSVKIWKYEWYFLVMKLKHCPILPPPLIIIPHVWRLCKEILTRCRCRQSKESLNIDVDEQNLHIFEQDCAANYISKKAEEHEISEMINTMGKELENRLTRMEQRLKRMDKRMESGYYGKRNRQNDE